MPSLDFLIGVGERAVKTFAQALLASFAVGATVLTVHWPAALAVAGTATLLSVLTSLASLPIGGQPPPLTRVADVAGRHEAPDPTPPPPYPYPEEPHAQ